MAWLKLLKNYLCRVIMVQQIREGSTPRDNVQLEHAISCTHIIYQYADTFDPNQFKIKYFKLCYKNTCKNAVSIEKLQTSMLNIKARFHECMKIRLHGW